MLSASRIYASRSCMTIAPPLSVFLLTISGLLLNCFSAALSLVVRFEEGFPIFWIMAFMFRNSFDTIEGVYIVSPMLNRVKNGFRIKMAVNRLGGCGSG